jgi:hypothetical protein
MPHFMPFVAERFCGFLTGPENSLRHDCDTIWCIRRNTFAAELIVTVKPLDWVSWSEARTQMPVIWDVWRYLPARADRAMINCLRRGKVTNRGEAYETLRLFGWYLSTLYDRPLQLQEVVTGLSALRFTPRETVVEYEITEIGSVRTPDGPVPAPLKVRRTAVIIGAELAWTELRYDLIRFELPAGATPDDEEPSTNRRKGRIPKPVWKAAQAEATNWLNDNGFPAPGDGDQAKLEKHITDWLGDRNQHCAASTVRAHVVQWIKDYIANLPPDQTEADLQISDLD